MKKLLVIPAALLGLLIPASGAAAKSYTIKTNQWAVTKLGPFDTRYSAHTSPTLDRAIAAFGRPSSKFEKSGGCVVKWQRLGLRIEFYNFGTSESSCIPSVGIAQSFTIKESRKWRTWNGLRINMRESRIWTLHPAAEWHGGNRYQPAGYWLRYNYSPIGDGGDYPVISAHIRLSTTRIYSFQGWIGGAGE